VKDNYFLQKTFLRNRNISSLSILILSICLQGCSDNVRMATDQEVSVFERTRQITSKVDVDRVEKAKLKTGPYRVVPGDVLEFTMPALLQAVTAAEVQAVDTQHRQDYPYLARVSSKGTITLPAVGRMEVVGQSLAEIEEDVVRAYQDYLVLEPSVFVRVSEYKTYKVYIAGAVEKPGVYTLRNDQMTLSYLMTEAGGISEAGAATVRVVRSDEQADSLSSNETLSKPILLPVANTNIPSRDIALEEGDTVVVEPVQMPLFSVLGLVNKPGNFPYPPYAQYNLGQAVAYAGGLDHISDPRYAMIYRLDEEGLVTRVPFKLKEKDEFTQALSTPIQPGDVVAIEHTARTRMNTIVNQLVRINMGVYLQGKDLWDNHD
jgi:protein involved in polysaccharide export with SLBB domain